MSPLNSPKLVYPQREQMDFSWIPRMFATPLRPSLTTWSTWRSAMASPPGSIRKTHMLQSLVMRRRARTRMPLHSFHLFRLCLRWHVPNACLIPYDSLEGQKARSIHGWSMRSAALKHCWNAQAVLQGPALEKGDAHSRNARNGGEFRLPKCLSQSQTLVLRIGSPG